MPTNPLEPPKGKRLTTALAIFALVVVPLAVYLAGYWGLSSVLLWYDDGVGRNYTAPPPGVRLAVIERSYRQQWMTTLFRPATKVEQWVRGVEVQATWSADPQRALYDGAMPMQAGP